jgi:CCR4-NOT transcription complex subunit 3
LNGLGITDAGSVGSSHKRNMSSSASVDTGRSSLLGNNNNNNSNNSNSNANNNAQNVNVNGSSNSGVNTTTINNGILQESFATLPQSNEHDRTNIRSNSYTPQNPYPATPASYPTTPNAIFENPAIFEKLGTDALFYIFYYKQGSYQQYLAARELKKQSWRFHKKYMTWFQRHEEPKVTTDEYEQGTYVYFDWETGWCTRIKQDFRFEYSFLEDTLQ